jgi:hypothetical protein
MHQDLTDSLVELPKESLIKIIVALYGSNKEIDERIDAMLLQTDAIQLFKALKKRVQSLKRSTRFIGYGESYVFSQILSNILQDIKNFLLPLSPKKSFELLELFFASAKNTLERVDDSGGWVGGCYDEAVTLWLAVASAWQSSDEACEINWQEEVYRLFQDNNYGVYDGLISGSAELLKEDALRQLAWRFENDARKALNSAEDNDKKYNSAASHACIGLRSVAEALQDIALYERATLITSPDPNSLQKESLAKFSLQLGQPVSALKWLDTSWGERFEHDRLRLLDQCYQQLGDTEKLRDLRKQLYRQYPSFDSLSQLIEVSLASEKNQLLMQARSDAKTMSDLSIAVDLLIHLEDFAAAEALVISRFEDLARCYYPDLIDFAKAFETQGKTLGAILCYRVLLEDILNEARSKAYPHAARYYKKLRALSKSYPGYDRFADFITYDSALKSQHARKHSFWPLVAGN